MKLIKSLIGAVLLALLVASPAHATVPGPYFGYVQEGGQTVFTSSQRSTTNVQRSFPGATVKVCVVGTGCSASAGTVATLASDSSGTAKANPFSAGTDGSFAFWSNTATFDIVFYGKGITTQCGTGSQLPCISAFTWTSQAFPSGGSGSSSPLTTKGDVYGHSTVDARIPVGTDNYSFMGDSTVTLGVAYHPTVSTYITLVSRLATSGDGSSGNPWSGWETAVNALPVNSHIHWPAGYYILALRINLKQGDLADGDGMEVSIIQSALSTTAFFLGDPTNGATPTHVSSWNTMRDLKVICSNNANVGSGVLIVYNNFTTLQRVDITGFRYGVSIIYGEIINLVDCYIGVQLSTGASVWIVDNGDYNLTNADIDFSGAVPGISNVIDIRGCQLSANLGIADDGGYSHTIGPNNNFNSIVTGILMTATNRGSIIENHFEATGPPVHLMPTFWKSGAAAAANSATSIVHNYFSTSSGSSVVLGVASTRTLVLDTNHVAGAVATISGCASGFTGSNSSVTVIGSVPLSGTLVFDVVPTIPSTQLNGTINRTLAFSKHQQITGTPSTTNSSAGTYVDLSGFAITQTTNATDLVKLVVDGVFQKSTAGYGSVVIDRGGTKLPGDGVHSIARCNLIGTFIQFHIEYYDTPGLGTWTYQVQNYTSDANTFNVGGGITTNFISEIVR